MEEDKITESTEMPEDVLESIKKNDSLKQELSNKLQALKLMLGTYEAKALEETEATAEGDYDLPAPTVVSLDTIQYAVSILSNIVNATLQIKINSRSNVMTAECDVVLSKAIKAFEVTVDKLSK